jgi:acyl-CoA dehydrogenase
MIEPLLDHREGEVRSTACASTPERRARRGRARLRARAERLVPARLTHCMRWLGLADRALELCKYITERTSFGKELARHQLMQEMIAENATAIHAGNLMTCTAPGC